MADFLLSILLFQWVGFTILIQVVEIKGKLNIVLKFLKILKRHENRHVNKTLMAITSIKQNRKYSQIHNTNLCKEETNKLVAVVKCRTSKRFLPILEENDGG